MDCCKQHGLPIKCLEQKLESKTESEHNNTHMVITTIVSKECHDSKSILQECKEQCMTNAAPNKKFIHNTNHEDLNLRLKGRKIPFHGNVNTMPHAQSKDDKGINQDMRRVSGIFILFIVGYKL